MAPPMAGPSLRAPIKGEGLTSLDQLIQPIEPPLSLEATTESPTTEESVRPTVMEASRQRH